jgi:alkanesulfonate monooxygenase SsuD/methylene tetrahydromethanopterin reductase-like flavin-dependent oxidoreductase (luciferase family)
MPVSVGAVFPEYGSPEVAPPDVAGLAVVAEQAGLDGVWSGDGLAVGDRSVLDASLTLAVAAAVTSRIEIGFAIFVPSLRPLAWAAKQVASLQHHAGGRLRLGVGIGGGQSGAEYLAAGFRREDRAARTDDFLRLLPDLLDGQPVVIPDCPAAGPLRLLPAVAMPPVWIGGTSPAALRRAARFGDGWISGFQTPAEFAASARQLGELASAAGRGRPRLGVCLSAYIGKPGSDSSATSLAEESAAIMQTSYGASAERARELAIAGTPAQVAGRLASFVEAGAELLLVEADPAPCPESWELLAEVRRLLI